MKKNCGTTALLAFLIAIISSCQPASTIQNLQVRTVSPEKSTGDAEEFPLNNCGGNGKLIQTLGMQGSVTKSIEMGASVSLSGGGAVGIPAAEQLEVEAAVEAAYKQEYEVAKSRLDTVIMEVAPKSYVIYTIEWERLAFSSEVVFEYDGEMLQEPYTFILNIPKIGGSREVICFDTPLPPTSTTTACLYQGNSDKETFEMLMRAEQQAALTEDLDMLDGIFLPGTLLTDPSGVTSPVHEHYQKKFADVDFVELDLLAIEIVKINETSAWVTQSATGSFVITESGQRIDYEIKLGDGQLVFQRDSNGCWKMSNFVE